MRIIKFRATIMPTISTFFGIAVRMYFDDHNPPHFHVYYNEFDAIIRIDTIEVIEGSLPKRALAMVAEWTLINRKELLKNWELAKKHKELKKIKPLD